MSFREEYERQEHTLLSPRAAFADEAERDFPCEPCTYRTAFQRDRDRILHAKSFRRLKHKTQVFLSPEGDHYRTRLTHTLQVSQVARTVARALRLNEDLTEAIALGHDLGHTPFGHAGERALDRLVEGGFRHYEQSVRVVEHLEHDGRGLNLTRQTRDGILAHTSGREAETLEGRIVRWADKISYLSHDVDDAIRAGVLKASDIPESITAVFGEGCCHGIDTMVRSLIQNSGETIEMDAETYAAFDRLKSFMFDAVYFNPVAKGEERKIDGLVQQMFEHFIAHPDTLPAEYFVVRAEDGDERAVCDYIAGMTDNYALDMYHQLFIPRSWDIT